MRSSSRIRPRVGWRREQGSATMLALAWLTVLAVVATVALLVTLVAAAQHQVESAADLAAVSAASHAVEGERAACAAAERVATSMRARVRSCRLIGFDVRIDVATTVDTPVKRLTLTASARAGPAEDTSGS